MKTIKLILLGILLSTGIAQAQRQQLLNPGFELWDTIGDYTQPKNWFSLNPLVVYGFEQSTNLTTDAHSGKFAVALESKESFGNGYTGLIASGPILDSKNNPDFSQLCIGFNSNPIALKFYYKSFPKNGDTCVFSFLLLKWNKTLQKNDTIASANKFFTDSVAAYTLATIPVTYYAAVVPDSAQIIASSSLDGFNPITGSKLILDDIELVYPSAGLKTIAENTVVKIYPNPVKDILTIEHESGAEYLVEIVDFYGRKITESRSEMNLQTIDLSNFQNGMYVLLINDKFNQTKSFKILVQH